VVITYLPYDKEKEVTAASVLMGGDSLAVTYLAPSAMN